jgi:hypothetical protein
MDDSLLGKFLGRRTGGFRFGRGRRSIVAFYVVKKF